MPSPKPEIRMLPAQWLERIFERLIATYGRDFLSRWEGLELAAVQAAWARDLGGFATEDGKRRIAHALDNLPPKAPNAIEFRALCNQAPADDGYLALPRARVELTKGQIGKLRTVRGLFTSSAPAKTWAHRLREREEAGERLTAMQRQAWRSALAGEVA